MDHPVDSDVLDPSELLSGIPAVRTEQRQWVFTKAQTWRKLGLLALSLFLFILATTLMKEGARGLESLVRDGFSVSNAANSLGFGWLFAYVVMSGSPVAAATLTFFDAGILDQVGAFTMITGSRLGASFIVLFIGYVYVLRGRTRANSLSMGLLALVVTASTYLLALAIGLTILTAGILDHIQPRSGILLTSVVDAIFGPIVAALLAVFPTWSLFIVGLGIIIVSFHLFDKCLPELAVKESQVGRVSLLVRRPWVMFALGSLITLISMSVSISLSILVPLNERGIVRRENVIPYIMGANITTFVDTLLAAVLLRNSAAFTVVLVEMLSIAVVSAVILAFLYRPFERSMLTLVTWITHRRRNLAFFMFAILAAPIMLLLM